MVSTFGDNDGNQLITIDASVGSITGITSAQYRKTQRGVGV
jgi:hypothetical protein